jgi:hypothetical protein
MLVAACGRTLWLLNVRCSSFVVIVRFWPIAVYHQGQQPKAAIDRRRSSVRSVMFLDVMQSSCTAALRIDGAGLAWVRLSEKAAGAAAHCEVFHGPVCGRSRRGS